MSSALRYRSVVAKSERIEIEVAGKVVSVSSPKKLYFPEAGITKLELVQYYLAVSDGALRGAGGRPNVMKRWVDGASGEFFFQKRAPENRPAWIETVELRFPSGRTAEEVVPRDAAALAWMANLGCIDLNPHPVRTEDLDHPDELRIDLDPMPGNTWDDLRAVAREVHAVLDELSLVGWPKTSGSRGIHVNVRLHPRWSFDEVRRSALAIGREVERRMPGRATAKWWKEERIGVFIDYNQNAKDRTVASAYSVRPLPDARVSMPLTWAELDACHPEEFTLKTVPAMFQRDGDRHAGIDAHPCSLDAVLALSQRQEGEGQSDAPWPPHYQKAEGEPARVAPSRAKKSPAKRPVKAASEAAASEAGDEGGAPKVAARRKSTKPMIEIARAKKKDEALAALEQWKTTHPAVLPHLLERDVLVDPMRGRYTTWTRIRINLENVPEAIRPAQEGLIVDYDPKVEWQAMEGTPEWEHHFGKATKAPRKRAPRKNGESMSTEAEGTTKASPNEPPPE
jgi:bifunctional non-homologous end joining protein LigD